MFLNISTTYIWFGLALLFCFAELATTSLVSIWFAAGSVAAVLLSLVVDSPVAELVVFIAVSGAMLFFTRPIVAKKLLKSTPTNADMLLGKTARVIQPIAQDKPGRVTIDGLTWLARSSTPLEIGENCTVVKIEGASLICEGQTVTTGS
ncbi:MAG: NfeD family protein [Oscillospiraceae bacterium]